MDCYKCDINDICDIFSFFKEYSYIAKINITECKKLRGKNNNKPATVNNIFERPLRKNLSENEKKDNKDFKVVDLSDKETFTPLIKCPTCGCKTPEDDLKICAKCSKVICGNCGTHDSKTNSDYCNDCWSKLE